MRPKALFLIALICCMTSCIKDTDFEQADQITLSPEYELDLVYFTVDPTMFTAVGELGEAFRVSDTTNIRFLDDSFIQESLVRAEVFFKLTNSIPRDFQLEVEFMTLNNEVQYQFDIPIAAGTVAAPVITEHLEVFDTAAELGPLTSSSRVVISVSSPETVETLDGTLNLQSKSAYFLEF
ncbi:hypothetical protein [Gilvibacter sediminis]|uniref:hypothetical protein n=1 Tax=Gilvibacter sediminis TaxID=379071 RepID=UPI00234FEA4E|nr:hypothetical protein [Gilvibacter sediminis]MDC7997610.1 hypothetical protein [Gilvibacter sediminis]